MLALCTNCWYLSPPQPLLRPKSKSGKLDWCPSRAPKVMLPKKCNTQSQSARQEKSVLAQETLNSLRRRARSPSTVQTNENAAAKPDVKELVHQAKCTQCKRPDAERTKQQAKQRRGHRSMHSGSASTLESGQHRIRTRRPFPPDATVAIWLRPKMPKVQQRMLICMCPHASNAILIFSCAIHHKCQLQQYLYIYIYIYTIPPLEFCCFPLGLLL